LVDGRNIDRQLKNVRIAFAEEGRRALQYYALIYDLVDDYIERRSALRAAHLKLAAESHDRGELVLAGAFAEPTDQALLVFRAPDRSVPEAFVREDPYRTHGLVKSWKVRPWTVVVGNQ
jgi:uncharacterized protein